MSSLKRMRKTPDKILKSALNEKTMSPPRRLRLNDRFMEDDDDEENLAPNIGLPRIPTLKQRKSDKPALKMRVKVREKRDSSDGEDDTSQDDGPLTPPPYRRKTSGGYQLSGRDDYDECEPYTASPRRATPYDKFFSGDDAYLSPVSSPLQITKSEDGPNSYSVSSRPKYPYSPNPFSPHFSPHISPNPFSSPHVLSAAPTPIVKHTSSSSHQSNYASIFNTKSFDSSDTANTDTMSTGSMGADTTILTPPTPAKQEFNRAKIFSFSNLSDSPRPSANFTGSPILEEDTTASSSDISLLYGSGTNRPFLQVQCHHPNTTKIYEEDSPTDVLTFPPPPPSKNRNAMSRTPLKSSNVSHDTAPFRPRCTASRFDVDFDVIGTLGTGSFGTVYKCMGKLDGCMYAIKTVKSKSKGFAARERMLKEVYALAALCDQPANATFHIVRYHQAWMEENQLFIQTEVCTSTLTCEMKAAKGPLCEKRRFKVLREILLALELLHRNGMVHLDIKPDNIFIKNDIYKLGDFGLVSQVTTNNDVEEGDSRYMSMELLSGDHKDLTKSDIFSLGATIYEVCLTTPLPCSGPQWQSIRAGTLVSMPQTPQTLQKLIREMMHPDPDIRPPAKVLLQKRQLLSEEQKQLIIEKNRVVEANRALEFHFKKNMICPLKGKLVRSSTWDVGMSKFP